MLVENLFRGEICHSEVCSLLNTLILTDKPIHSYLINLLCKYLKISAKMPYIWYYGNINLLLRYPKCALKVNVWEFFIYWFNRCYLIEDNTWFSLFEIPSIWSSFCECLIFVSWNNCISLILFHTKVHNSQQLIYISFCFT